ncbi:MAG: sulfatase [Planctomycetota bacterium]
MSQPNILYLHSHDTGRYIRPYGYDVPTPNLQALAEEGILMRQAFCTNPTCSPSRASLLTGRWPHCNGMEGLSHRGWKLNDYGHHILHTLREHGYYSALCGVQHIASGDVDRIGYDAVLGRDTGHSGAIEYMAEQFLREPPQRPFFLSVGLRDTHRDWPEPGKDCRQTDPRFVRPPDPIPDTPETRYDMAGYNVDARTLDRKMGIVLDALEEGGLADETLLICTTDHGIAFPRMKCNLEDSGIGVMLILRGPGLPGGEAVDGMVSQVDVFPTVCDYLGVDRPDWLQGVSFLPVLRGEADEVRDELFAEVNYHAAYEPMRAVRTKRWKYIRRWQERPGPVLPNCDEGITKDFWLRRGWKHKAPLREALFDLTFDPHEANNRAGDPECADVLADMRGRLERFMQETDDPLLKGYVEPPDGARVNDEDGISPQQPTRIAGEDWYPTPDSEPGE